MDMSHPEDATAERQDIEQWRTKWPTQKMRETLAAPECGGCEKWAAKGVTETLIPRFPSTRTAHQLGIPSWGAEITVRLECYRSHWLQCLSELEKQKRGRFCRDPQKAEVILGDTKEKARCETRMDGEECRRNPLVKQVSWWVGQ